jgi:membrane associated rhomboid family serine protease
MGLYDRDYSRPEPSAFGGSYAIGQSMVVTIIAINGAVFLADLFFGGPDHRIMDALAATGNSLVKPWLWWQLLTAGFAHDPYDVMHLVFNMLGLWFLGRFVEQYLGRWEFLRFYLIAIVVGNVVHAARICLFVDPQFWGSLSLVGASGAVTAVVILFVCRFPHVKLLLFFAIPVPAWLVGLLIVGQDMLGNGGIFLNPFADSADATRVAYDVHLAGAGFACLYYFLGINFGNWWPSQWGGIASSAAGALRKRPNLRVHQPTDPELDEEQYRDLDEEADRILAKLGTQGENSLTPAERRVLEDYSRRMRQKHR